MLGLVQWFSSHLNDLAYFSVPVPSPGDRSTTAEATRNLPSADLAPQITTTGGEVAVDVYIYVSCYNITMMYLNNSAHLNS